MNYFYLILMLLFSTLVYADVLQQGTYLSLKYMQKIQSTLSTKKALELNLENSIPTTFEIEQVINNLRFQEGWNFHEGGGEFIRYSNGSIEVTVPDGREKNPFLKIINKQQFFIRWKEYESYYLFVGDAKRWVAEQLLVGVYRSDDGLEIKFRKDGSACLLHGETNFTVELDHIMVNFDDSIKGKNYEYAFKRIANELLLYQIIDEEDNIEPVPFWRGSLQINADINKPCSLK